MDPYANGFLDGMACAVEALRRHLSEPGQPAQDEPPHTLPTPMQVWHPETVGFVRIPEQED